MIKKKALQPSHPSQSQGQKSSINGRGAPNDASPSNGRQQPRGQRPNVTASINTNSYASAPRSQPSTQTGNPARKTSAVDHRNSPIYNALDYRDHSQRSSRHKKDDNDNVDKTSVNSQELQMQHYYSDINKLKEHIKTNFAQLGYMLKSTSDFYRIGRVLGRGAFGKVNLACHKVSEHLVAIKSIEYAVLRNEKEHKRRLMQEMSILKQSAH